MVIYKFIQIKRCKSLLYNAFTIVELLVVIGIIAVLASMLLPVLNKTRKQAQNALCSSNIKQVSSAMGLYVDDFDGFYPPLAWGNEAWGSTKITWCRLIAHYCGVNITKTVGGGYGILKSDCVFRCPSQPSWSGADYASCSYGYNYSYFGDYNYIRANSAAKASSGYGRKISAIKLPSKQLVNADTCKSNSKYEYRINGNYKCEKDRIAFRHSNNANVSYADGHVQAQSYMLLGTGNARFLPFNGDGTFLPWSYQEIWPYELNY